MDCGDESEKQGFSLYAQVLRSTRVLEIVMGCFFSTQGQFLKSLAVLSEGIQMLFMTPKEELNAGERTYGPEEEETRYAGGWWELSLSSGCQSKGNVS